MVITEINRTVYSCNALPVEQRLSQDVEEVIKDEVNTERTPDRISHAKPTPSCPNLRQYEQKRIQYEECDE